MTDEISSKPADTKPNITGECAYCDWPACAAVGGVNVCMVHIITEPVQATEPTPLPCGNCAGDTHHPSCPRAAGCQATEPTCKSYGAGHRCTLPEGHGGTHHFDTPLNTTTCPHGCDGTGDEPDCPRHGATSASMPLRDTTTCICGRGSLMSTGHSPECMAQRNTTTNLAIEPWQRAVLDRILEGDRINIMVPPRRRLVPGLPVETCDYCGTAYNTSPLGNVVTLHACAAKARAAMEAGNV
jgi:hypothetical protein